MCVLEQRGDLEGLRRIEPGGAPDALIAVADRYVDEFDACHRPIMTWNAVRSQRRCVYSHGLEP